MDGYAKIGKQWTTLVCIGCQPIIAANMRSGGEPSATQVCRLSVDFWAKLSPEPTRRQYDGVNAPGDVGLCSGTGWVVKPDI